VTEPDRRRSGRTYLALADPHLRTLIEKRPDYDPHAALSELPSMDPFGVLLFQIIGQQISIPATRAILKPVIDQFDGHLPTPTDVLDRDATVLRDAGVSARKAATIRALAQLVTSTQLDHSTFARMTDDEIEQTLTRVPGIGTWTVQGFLVIALDRPDAFPAGDLGIRRAIRDLYHLDRLPTEDEARARAEAWRPYRALAAGYLISWDAERGRHQFDTRGGRGM
jgi:DNA-3-methyladenine glycosylase II